MSVMDINIKAHSLQLMMEPKGITNEDGTVKANLTLTCDGVQMRIDPRLFPFVQVGEPVLVILSMTQITPKEQAIVPSSKLIIPGVN